jgi:hypothetical protein
MAVQLVDMRHERNKIVTAERVSPEKVLYPPQLAYQPRNGLATASGFEGPLDHFGFLQSAGSVPRTRQAAHEAPFVFGAFLKRAGSISTRRAIRLGI